uniref:Uncharacterized protein n=1 Tax=Pithovirus LCPAC103 TaxID=2506588 RepID=A0A481Z3B5_9VIRU|nr:MAG: hypothetical protein LCPAC103_00540 [Pithovirus LCPAC103]
MDLKLTKTDTTAELSKTAKTDTSVGFWSRALALVFCRFLEQSSSLGFLSVFGAEL